MKYRSCGGYFQNCKVDIELLTVETITNFCYLFSSCAAMLSCEHAFDTYQLYAGRPHYTVFKRKRYCFVLDKATVHTTTPKTTSENGSIRKRFPEWNDNVKTVLFEDAVFPVWTAKTMLSESYDVTATTRPGCRPLSREYPR